jgi:hypothetical protein
MVKKAQNILTMVVKKACVVGRNNHSIFLVKLVKAADRKLIASHTSTTRTPVRWREKRLEARRVVRFNIKFQPGTKLLLF